MATVLTELVEELKDNTRWQKIPLPLMDADYVNMVKRAIRQLYVDTGRASVYNSGLFTENSYGDITFSNTLAADEIEYTLICAQINFFKRVATDVNNILGYVSDALTVTNADKPYANLKDTMDRLENERRIKYFKMHRYAMPAT
jgi:hypothetical protein